MEEEVAWATRRLNLGADDGGRPRPQLLVVDAAREEACDAVDVEKQRADEVGKTMAFGRHAAEHKVITVTEWPATCHHRITE